MRKIILIALAVFLPSAVMAEELRFGCENPRRPYLAVYDNVAKTFVIDPDTARVAYSVTNGSALYAEGEVSKDSGLTFKAFFGPNPRIRYYAGGKAVQTDICKPAVIDLMGN